MGGSDTRRTRLVALFVPAREPSTPFLPAGRFKATWQGKIVLELGGEYTFAVQGRGNVQVRINGAVVLEGAGPELKGNGSKAITLIKGANELLVTYESPAEGDAALRLFWECSEFRREPLAWSVVRHDPKDKDLIQGKLLREGRELLATQRCVRCHAADTETWLREGGMPELAMDAPSLTEIGSRLNADWMAHWIQDPHKLRPCATMPRVFADAAIGDKAALDERVVDIAAYLASLGSGHKKEPPAKEETVQEGTRLFVNLGCLACHTPPGKDDFAGDEKNRVPLRDVSAKWQPAALRAFLRQPDRHYQWIRMPNFQLKEEEAARLAAYLLAAEKRTLFAPLPEKAQVERGQKLVLSSGCLNCHTLQDGKPLTSTLHGPALADIKPERRKSGCLQAGDKREGHAPVLLLTAEQQKALQALLADGRQSLRRESAVEFAGRQMRILRCNACHRRDAQEDDWSQLRDEEAGLTAGLPAVDPETEPKHFKADQIRPSLTWTGEKLKPEWMATFIAGKLPYKPREYLRARMPAFPRRADLLAHGLAHEHGYSAQPEPVAAVDEKLAEIGRDLVGKKRWSCTACHDMGKTEAVGVFESPGPNFMYIKDRLRRDYYDRWLWLPSRVEPGTKMPQVYMVGKPSLLADVLEGDAGRQIDAIWNFILQGKALKPPAESSE